MVGIAVNVTETPAQMVVPGLAEMDTLTGRFGLTVMVIALLVTCGGAHGVRLDVILTVTTSPLFSVVVVYVGLLAPTGVAPTYH